MTIDEKTQKEILKALSLIQNVCKECTGCDSCPLSDRDDNCLICGTEPVYWKITDKESVWKALH